MPVLIELNGVTARNDDGRVVFENVSVNFPSGQRVFVSGPPASGKGLLSRLLVGLSAPDSGSVLLFGGDTKTLRKARLYDVRKRIGLIQQDPILISNLKVIENVALPLLYHSGLSSEACFKEALALLDAGGFRGDLWGLPGLLPLSTKKLITVVKALAMKPDVVICEDLAFGLSPEELLHLSGLIADYQQADPARLLIALASHESEIGVIKPDRVLWIVDAKLVE